MARKAARKTGSARSGRASGNNRRAKARRARASRAPQPSNRRSRVIAGSLLALVAAVAVVVILLTGGDDEGQATEPVDVASLSAGETLFRVNCAQCHGVDLNGTDSGPPFLIATYAPNHHGDEAFQSAAANGVTPHHWNFGPMPPVEGLSRDDVAQIIAYIRSRQVEAGITNDPSHP